MTLRLPTILLLPALLAAMALFAAPGAAYGAKVEVESIRHWSTPNYTRVVIDLESKAKFTHHLLKEDVALGKPPRLYVDITGATLKKGLLTKIPINDGLLKTVRVAQNDKETVRVVLDIESIKDYKVFPLSNPYRIVIDINGSATKGPGEPLVPPSSIDTTGMAGGEKTTPEGPKLDIIVIDAGHGGKDPGAIGRGGLKEKDITLKLARLLKKELDGKLKARVILTRSKDVFISLDERTVIAKMKDADLFVSIHVNASRSRKAHGIETYYMDYSNDKEANRVAARENAVTEKEMDDLQFIIKDLVRTGNRKESSALAASVQAELSATLKKKYKGIKSNGVKGAPFYVLANAHMPSILVEVSFITNPRDEKRLKEKSYLNQIVKGITEGILVFAGLAEEE